MKVRITDLLDQFEDYYGTLEPGETGEEQPKGKETITVKQSKHSFSWKQGLSLAAALAVVVLAGFGISSLLKNRKPQSVTPADGISDTKDEVKEPAAEDVRNVEIPLSDEDQKSVNLFLTYLSQQGITEFVPGKVSEYELASFVHLYFKLNDRDAIKYQTETVYGDTIYETFTLEQANAITERFFGVTLHPAEGTDYTLQNGNNYILHEQYHDGIFWFPAADGDMHTGFSVCDTVNKNSEGELEITFTTYNVHDIDDYYDKFETVYTGLRIPAAEDLVGEGELFKTMHGNAKLRPVKDGWLLLVYEARVLEDGPDHREDDEEWPQEYPVTEYRLEGDVFKMHGEVNAYRYEPLPMDDGYQIVLHSYAESALDSVGKMSLEPDSEHDGYANWTMYGPNGNAFVSGSSITGRFCFTMSHSFEKVLEMTEAKIENKEMMEQKAKDFVALFPDIVGELVLDHWDYDTCYYHDERSSEMKDVEVPAITYYFRTPTGGRQKLAMREGYEAPIVCGDSGVLDLDYNCFSVTVWPDGTVVKADNYLTNANIVGNGTVRLPEEEDMENLLSFFSSTAENDTLVITAIKPTQYGVYFGSADIEPDVVVEYYYASKPDEKQSTLFVLRGLTD